MRHKSLHLFRYAEGYVQDGAGRTRRLEPKPLSRRDLHRAHAIHKSIHRFAREEEEARTEALETMDV